MEITACEIDAVVISLVIISAILPISDRKKREVDVFRIEVATNLDVNSTHKIKKMTHARYVDELNSVH